MVVLGGMGSIVGSLVGAAVLMVLPQALTVLHDYEHMVLGLMLMGFMIFLRQGIVPSLAALARRTGDVTILAAERLSIAFGGVRAVDDVSLAVASAAWCSRSSGRTAPARPRCSTCSPASTCRKHGRVRLAGEDVTGLAPDRLARRGLSRTFQNLQIFFRMTALENVMVGRHRHEATGALSDLLHLPAVGRQNRATREAAQAALARVGLADHADRSAAGALALRRA